jgi:hypothetical protein
MISAGCWPLLVQLAAPLPCTSMCTAAYYNMPCPAGRVPTAVRVLTLLKGCSCIMQQHSGAALEAFLRGATLPCLCPTTTAEALICCNQKVICR